MGKLGTTGPSLILGHFAMQATINHRRSMILPEELLDRMRFISNVVAAVTGVPPA